MKTCPSHCCLPGTGFPHTCQLHISLSVPGTKDHIWKEKMGSYCVKITNIEVARALIHYEANKMPSYLAVEHVGEEVVFMGQSHGGRGIVNGVALR